MNLPIQFLDRMKKMLGQDFDKFLDSYNYPSRHGLRLNSLKNTEFLKEHLTPIAWCNEGYYYKEDFTPGKLPFHNMGLYYIQEPSAMSAVEILNPKLHETILDLCASPGGKSTQIATKMANTGLLVSNEIIPKRASVLKDNIARLGITNCIVLNETPENIAQKFSGFFDKILVDAPCSGEGMFRKNPEAMSEWSLNNVETCAIRQLNILNTIKNCVKEDGIIVYSTCTFSPEENEQVIEEFLLENPQFELMTINNPHFSHGEPKWSKFNTKSLSKTARIFPHITDGEGHFVALLKNNAENDRAIPPQKQSISKKYLEIYRKFEKETLNINLDGTFMQFGDNIYLLPKSCPKLDRLKVVYSGILLGTITKDRFEPSYEFSLSLRAEDAKLTHEITDINKYLHGETLSSTLTNGWCLITCKNNPVSWGKCVKGTIKNFYPKYLRI